MDMSVDYMRESCDFLQTKGFDVRSRSEQIELEPGSHATLFTFELSRGEHERFNLEAWRYPDGTERYYLEVARYHHLASTSFPLDSWKYKPHQIEFKYYVMDESSMGLSFILTLEAQTP